MKNKSPGKKIEGQELEVFWRNSGESLKIFPDTPLGCFCLLKGADILRNHMPIFMQSCATFELATAAQTFLSETILYLAAMKVCLQLWIFLKLQK